MLNPPAHRGPSRGFALVGLVTAGALGLFILSGVAFLFAGTVRAGATALKTAHLQQSLLTVLHRMSAELRRAGYWSRSERTLDGAATNGFAALHVVDGRCILFSYDEDKDDPDGIPDPGDQGGFRLTDGRIQVKSSDPWCGDTTCRSCQSGRWWALTDPRTLLITGLHFSETRTTWPLNDDRNTVTARRIRIRLSGALASDPGLRRTLETSVDVRNDDIR